MYSFEGDFKRKPSQAFRGASKKEPLEVLLQRTQEERKKRELQKRMLESAIRIQSCYRAFRVRQLSKELLRQQYDAAVLNLQKMPSDDKATNVSELIKLEHWLVFFYNPRVDSSRLMWLCQQFVKLYGKIVPLLCDTGSVAFYRIKHLLVLCCRQIQLNAENITMFLRVLEVYTDPNVFKGCHNLSPSVDPIVALHLILSHLVESGYYQCIRALIDVRLPKSLQHGDNAKSLVPMADTIMTLIKRPLLFVSDKATADFGLAVLSHLCSALFATRYSEQVHNYLLPLVAQDRQFPYVTLLRSLLPCGLLNGTIKAEEQWSLNVSPSLWLLHSTMAIGEPHLDSLSDQDMYLYLLILHKLVPQLIVDSSGTSSVFMDDSDDDEMEVEPESDVVEICNKCVEMLNHSLLVRRLVGLATSQSTEFVLTAVASVCHALLYNKKAAIHRTPLLYSLAFSAPFISGLWQTCVTSSTLQVTGSQFLLVVLSRGLQLSQSDFDRIIPLISTFCSLFAHVLALMYDTEFYRGADQMTAVQSSLPFTLPKLAHVALAMRDVCLGIVLLTHPDTMPVTSARHESDSVNVMRQLGMLSYVFKVAVGFVSQLYQRDCRQRFCQEGHWLLQQPLFSLDKIFHMLVNQDRSENQSPAVHFGLNEGINIAVRRNYLYEDAFEKLSPTNEPNLKKHMRVRLINFAGLDEAGVDGGGIFREFLSELIKTAFDPNRGFFLYTSNKLLYPNPQARLLVNNFTEHYYFLGRILGKMLYENILTELPFASFFLSKILTQLKGDVDINHLASLDPQMYRNLLFLKDYDGDVSELNLDFTVVNNDLGEIQVEELKRGGRDIPVTNSNRIEYIHLMADYRLNRQIRPHCSKFRSGLDDVVSIDWLRLFDHNELQVLISGAQMPIDIDDLREHTNYSGGYNTDHPVIQMFWRVTRSFDDEMRQKLLKFVTSCSRPPLLGFKNLHPSFCIHYAGREPDRLPTASTCMNLLKLPEFNDEETLREKLVYAIESSSGFELS